MAVAIHPSQRRGAVSRMTNPPMRIEVEIRNSFIWWVIVLKLSFINQRRPAVTLAVTSYR